MSDRICLKNIPEYITSERLHDICSAQGNVTDIRIMRTRTGRSRKFAFIGYRNHEEAKTAIKYFDKSFIDTSRITAEIALPPGHKDLIRPWSKYSKGSSKNDKYLTNKNQNNTENNTNDNNNDNDDTISKSKIMRENMTKYANGSLTAQEMDAIEKDNRYKDFLEIMKPRITQKVWDNDDTATSNLGVNRKEQLEDNDVSDKKKKKKKKKKRAYNSADDDDNNNSDSDEYDNNIIIDDIKIQDNNDDKKRKRSFF